MPVKLSLQGSPQDLPMALVVGSGCSDLHPKPSMGQRGWLLAPRFAPVQHQAGIRGNDTMTFFAIHLYSKMQPVSPNPRPLPNHGKTAVIAQLRDTRQVIKVAKTETPSTAWHRAGC